MDVCHELGVTDSRWTNSVTSSAAARQCHCTRSQPCARAFQAERSNHNKGILLMSNIRQRLQSRDFQAGDVLSFLSSQPLPVLLVPVRVRTSTGIPVTCPGVIISISFGMFNTQEAFSGFMHCNRWSAEQHQALHTEFTSGHWNTAQYLFFCWKYLIKQYA